MTFESLIGGTVLPDFHVSAPVPIEPHENKIHEDDLARQYGFKGGLVPGVIMYAWMTHPAVEALEEKGHEFVEADLLLVANGTRAVAAIRHTAIYLLRKAG
jgi:hypothetical protein